MTERTSTFPSLPIDPPRRGAPDDERDPAPIVVSAQDATEQRLTAFMESALRRANQEQVWLVFILDEDEPSQVVIVIEEIPSGPADERLVALPPFVEGVMRTTGAESVAIAWERLGSWQLGIADVERMRFIAGALDELDVPLREQYLVHSDGVRRIRRWDYA